MVKKLLDELSQKSYEKEEHITSMVEYADLLGRKIDLNSDQLMELWLLANVHDIEKITIPKNILIKNEKLTNNEWEIIKEHSKEGYNIIKSMDSFSFAADKVLYHHEHWDGSGYPKGLEGENIPLLSRIISIVDAYDVMTSERPYSHAKLKEEALKEIERCSGTQFDPELAEIFIKMLTEE
jgi:HD-GYP domain-containing protein (c-di-GMP phosphodiesterase class II)